MRTLGSFKDFLSHLSSADADLMPADRPKQDFDDLVQFRDEAKEAGYKNPRYIMCCSQVSLTAYDTKRGVSVTFKRKYKYHLAATGCVSVYLYKERQTPDEYEVYVRKHKAYKLAYTYSTSCEAFEVADKLQGMSKKKQLECHLKWRVPDPRSYRRTSSWTKLNRSIEYVFVPRLCVLERNIVKDEGLEIPNAEGFVVVETHDTYGRTLFFVLRDHDHYLLAVRRGPSICITNDKQLFTNGPRPLTPDTDISVDDLEFVYAVVEEHFGDNDVHTD
jgi:hypothetical protein